MKTAELLKCVHRCGVPSEFERSSFAGVDAAFARVADLYAEVQHCRASAWRPKCTKTAGRRPDKDVFDPKLK